MKRLAWLSLAVAACSAPQRPPPKPREALTPLEPAPMIVEPARWDFHAAAPDEALAYFAEKGGGCVMTSEGRRRWRSASSATIGGRAQCGGAAENSQALAEEELVGVFHPASKRWLFAGMSGALYEASDPLGTLERKIEAPEPIVRVASDGKKILAATKSGELLELAGTTWKPSTSPPAHTLDVALAPNGSGVALAFPEALFTTIDEGATWTRLAAPRVGAHRVGLNANGDLLAEGQLESLVIAPSKSSFDARAMTLHASPSLALEVAPGPSALQLLTGRATMDGEAFADVELGGPEKKISSLWRGKIEGRLTKDDRVLFAKCRDVRLSLRGHVLATACILDANEPRMSIARWSDDGKPIGDSLELRAAPIDPRVALSSDGSVLVSGACPVDPASESCSASSVAVVRWRGSAPSAIAAKTPALTGEPRLPAFSPDARSAYFVGTREKDGAVSIFVSHDAGESFEARSIEGERTAVVAPPSNEPEDGDEAPPPEPMHPTLEDWSTMTVGEDGSIGLVLANGDSSTYVTTDDDGRVLSAAAPPNENATIAGFGKRVLAIASSSDAVWESKDGGAHWSDPMPATPALAESQNSVGVQCGAGGCVIGDEVTRVGWSGSGGVEPPQEEPKRERVLDVRTPIACELAPGKWTHVDMETSQVDELTAMRGRVAWSGSSFDSVKKALTTTAAEMPAKRDGDAKITTRALFSPLPAAAHAALATAHLDQMEGYAAARVRVPFDEKTGVKIGAPLKDVEIAWENYMEGIHGHVTIPDAGPIEPGDVTANGKLLFYWPALISVSSHGVFVVPHHLGAKNGEAWFFDASGKSQRWKPAKWPAQGLLGPLSLRTDAAFAHGRPVMVGLPISPSWSPSVVFLAGAPSDPASPSWSVHAASLLPNIEGLMRAWDWSYRDHEVGVTVLASDPDHDIAWASFLPFENDGTFGPSEAIATPLDLGDRPKACSAEEREKTARLRAQLVPAGAPMFYGARHPVLVSESAKGAITTPPPVVLMTSGEVVHGAPATACLAAFVATSRSSPGVRAMIEGDLAHAWLFRPDTTKSGAEVRAMTCKYDPAVPIPNEVAESPGAMRPRR